MALCPIPVTASRLHGWIPRGTRLPPFEQVAYCIVKDADPQYPRALMRQGDDDLWWWVDVDGNDLHPEDVLFWKPRGPLPAVKAEKERCNATRDAVRKAD